MTSILDRWLGRSARSDDAPLSLDDWAQYLTFGGTAYPFALNQTMPGSPGEQIANSFTGYVQGAYKSNGVIFACMLARLLLFSEARFQFRQIRNGRPGDLFGTQALGLLEQPWPNGTTGGLLIRMIQDADLAGNAYITRRAPRLPGQRPYLQRLRPDWMTIIRGSRQRTSADRVSEFDLELVGYSYQPGGPTSGEKPRLLLPEDVAHFAPIPDPEASYRGMSWLTPVLSEILADGAATTHKRKFFEHGATPNMVVSLDPSIKREAFNDWISKFEDQHLGYLNAYKCLHPSTEVALWNGARCPASEVRVGDVVVSWADGNPVPGMVAVAEWQAPSPIVTVTTQRGRVIRTNDRHPFLTRRGWVDARDLRAGDLLTTGLGWGRPRLQDSLTPHEAWMVGLLVGDGCLVGSTPTVSMADAGVAARAGSVASIVKRPVRERAPYDYRVLGVTELVRGLGLNGKRAHEKRVPAAIMTGGIGVVCAFLSGLVDADGHVSDPARRWTCEVGITSTSESLLRDVQHLLASVGVNASLSSPPSMRAGATGGGSGVQRRHDAHRLIVSGQGPRIADLLNLSHRDKARRLAVYAKRPSGQDRSRVDRVVSVEVSEPEPTIGIEVADHHTHVTGGVVTHNTLYLGGGADAKVVGADFKQMDFKVTQGAGETRIAAAAGVPPVIVGLSEGLEQATYSNYAQARRRFADGTMRPLWREAAGSLATLVDVPPAAELWYDDRDIAFLQEDLKDAAEIQGVEASTIKTLIDAGYKPDSVAAAVTSGDWSKLDHTGLFSVQLQPPGTQLTNGSGEPSINGAAPAPATEPS